MSISTQVTRTGHERMSRAVLAGLVALSVLAGGLALSVSPALAVGLPETPTTKAATGVTSTTATLNGELNPGSSSEEVEYDFAYNVGVGCAGGLVAPASPVRIAGNHQSVSVDLKGLQPNAQYAFCVVAANPAGPVLSSPATFTTLASKPSIDAENSSGVTPFEATVEAAVNANNQTTECEFQYGKTVAYGTTVSCEQPPFEGFGDQGGNVHLTGLEHATTYHFKVVAKNATGATESTDQQFSTLTLEAPVVEGESVSAITPSEATLEAQVNPEYQEASCELQYGSDASLGTSTTVPCSPEHLGNGGNGTSVNAVLSGLQSRATYYYRVLADNATGHVEGPVQSFTTQGSPLLTTGAAQSATRNTVLLFGAVVPLGLETTYRFEYISEVGYQAALAQSAENPYALGESTVPVNAGSGYETLAIGPEQIGGLLPGVTYHYALVANNALGVTIGHDATFTTTVPALPIVATGGASGVAQNTASIGATINTQGLATNYGFEIGTDTNYGPPTGLGAVGAGANEAVVSLSLSGLQPNTTYHYRIVATNVDGTSYGADMTFTTFAFANAFVTPPAPLPFVAVPAVSFPTEAGTVPVVSKKAVKKKSKKAKHKKKPAKGKHKTTSKKKK